MDFLIKEKLNEFEHEKIIEFLNSIDFYCIEQHPDWNVEIDQYTQTFFLCLDDNKNVNCFANIILSNGPFKIATINFGPAFQDFLILEKSIQFLHKYFSKLGFSKLSVQLGTITNPLVELFEYNINHLFKITYQFNEENVWSSILIDLLRSETEILQSFSKGHKSGIKRSAKTGMKTSVENSELNLNQFIELYIKMLEHRGHSINKIKIHQQLKNINNFLYLKNKGFFEYVFEEDTLVGGLIIIFQGKTARYFKGAADPERRDISVLHFGLFEAMKYCKARNFTSIDLWGYNHFADANDQLFYINRFKKGFSGEFIFFAKRINFILKPFNYKIYQFLKQFKDKISNSKNHRINLKSYLLHISNKAK